MCFRHWANGKARQGEAHIYAVWRHSGSRDVYIGTSRDVEQRYHGHFTRRSITFLPTIKELEEQVRCGEHTPYYEVIDSASIVGNQDRLRERQIATDLRELGFRVEGGR